VNNDWLDIELLEDYLDGKLDSKAMHRIEKQALEDPFVAQALAGLSESPKRASKSVSLLQKQLYDRIAQQQVSKKETTLVTFDSAADEHYTSYRFTVRSPPSESSKHKYKSINLLICS
jgi:hypothetical protein